MQDYGDLVGGPALPVRDLMAFLYEEGLDRAPPRRAGRRDASPTTTRAMPCARRASARSRGRCCGRSPACESSRSRTATAAAAPPVSTTSPSPRCPGACMREKAEAVRDTGAASSRARTPAARCSSGRPRGAGRRRRGRAPGAAARPSGERNRLAGRNASQQAAGGPGVGGRALPACGERRSGREQRRHRLATAR